MITLSAESLSWILENGDDPTDQCAHGGVHFRVNETTFVKATDGRWALSAAAMNLLRTLQESRTRDAQIETGSYLFPCCGQSVYIWDGRLVYPGCPTGIELCVTREGDVVRISGGEGAEETVSADEWKLAVLEFVAQIEMFYEKSAPKVVPDEDIEREGWAAFWTEWKRLVDESKHAASRDQL